jgi:hypothetical protein
MNFGHLLWRDDLTKAVTEAGNDAKVSKRVYIAAFAPDKGGSSPL